MSFLDPSVLLAFVNFAFVASITPGPNNLMVAASGAAFGIRATAPHIAGIALGFSVMLSSVALGLGAVLDRIAEMDNAAEIEADIAAVMATRPPMYMVNSDKGITNLHVPSDVIIDASLPAVIRAGGKGWGPDGKEGDTNCVVPDNSYAPVYEETVNYFKETGALDPSTSGTVQNIGLMAQKAEEYGSHPTTFEIPAAGTVTVVAANGDVLHSHDVEAGDIWRMASTRRDAIDNWIDLAISRQAITGYASVFWLDETRAHDAELLKVVKQSKTVAKKVAKI